MKRRLGYFALFLTCLTPIFAGFYRGTTLTLEWDWVPAPLQDRVDKLPLMIHVIGASVYYSLAAIQILPSVRKRYPRWHRLAGRVAITAGLASAVSCTWITFVHPEARGPILYAIRVVFAPLWTLFLVLGLLAIRRRDYSAHRDWMIRAFAVAMPAGTLIFIVIPFYIVLGELSDTLDESIQFGAFIVHLAVAEYLIRRIRHRKPKTPKGEIQYEYSM